MQNRSNPVQAADIESATAPQSHTTASNQARGAAAQLLVPPKDFYHLDPEITLSAPPLAGGAFTVSGTASCDLFKDIPNDEPNIFVRHADETITSVQVTVGAAGTFTATPTGPGNTPWTSWTLPVSGIAGGSQLITAKVFASDPPNAPGSAATTRTVVVDNTPPSIAINPPADVLVPAPPFIATITGTAADTPAGVAVVEWRYADGPFTAAAGTNSWAAQVALQPRVGDHVVVLRARDNLGNQSAEQNVTVKLGDKTEPSVGIDVPSVNAPAFPLVDGSVTIDVRGTASDTQTGVALVEWSLDSEAAYTPATPRAEGDWSTWSARITIDEAGSHTIFVRATDNAPLAPNRFVVNRAVVVAEPFEPADPSAVFSPAAYLDDLLDFTTHRAKTSHEGEPISRQLLVDTYLQPFAELVSQDNRPVANLAASQVRLCVDVLRRYMAKHERAVPSEGEAAYRQAAYAALLAGLGTSYEEIRLARVADGASREALASRLGIGLSQFRPDRLDQLLLQPADVSEAALKALFGLEETALKPLSDSLLPEAQLLIWQKEHLRALWQQQDDAAQSPFGTPLPLIDPDLLVAQDLRTPSPGNAAHDLWLSRQGDLAAFVAAQDAARRAQATQEAGFDKIVGDTLGPVAELLALDEAHRQGNDIEPDLLARRLTMPAFVHLMRVRELAVAASVLDAEWDDVYAILTQVNKLGRYAAWRSEEQQKGLILAPDHFRLLDATEAPAAVLPAWRATLQARQAWRRTLDARLQQEQTVTQAMQAVVGSAEEAALPLLRQACIVAIAAERDPVLIADRLTRELGIDCRDEGHQKTTRALQALATLQEVLLSLRTGRLKTEPPVLGTVNPAADWELAFDADKPYLEADFDEEWLWMGGYATWNAAMRVFAYPESYLLPELRPVSLADTDQRPTTAQTDAFGDFLTALRDQPRLTPVQARKLARDYLAQLATEALSPPMPVVLNGVVITDQLTDAELAARRQFVRDDVFAANGYTALSEVPSYLQEIFYFVPMALALQLQQSGQYLVALDWIETVYTDHFAAGDRKIYTGLVLEESIQTHYQRNPDNWLRVGLNPHEIVSVRASAYTRFTLMSLARCYLDFADAEFTRDDGEAVARARVLYGAALGLLALPEMQAPGSGGDASPFPPNPVPQALKTRAELNLFKLRSGRNIAGIPRQVPPIVQPSLTLDRLPVAGDLQRRFKPTPYRYNVLIERAKNLVSIAQQVEQAFLAALEKRDAETYSLLKAGQDLQLASAAVDLHTLQVLEAEQGVGVVERQQDRAETLRDTYQGWISAGLNGWERGVIDSHQLAGNAAIMLAGADAALTAAQAFASAAGAGVSGAAAGAAAAKVAALAFGRAELVALHAAAETAAQVDSVRASYERRNQEWQLQRQLADNDLATSRQQLAVAQTHAGVARQEAFISTTQRDHAEATVQFLAHKFTSAELYAWMSGVLGGAYNYFLQQATAMAQLAQYQLGFERQETPPAFIKADYWEATDNAAPTGSGQSEATDRRGLTGSVRLLQDITRLDQFAFDSNRRKLQLSETFSLAQLFPAEFQRFRETGSLPFATPMALFDRGFPGHYLRLLSRVSLSMIALVPPRQGVRATLIASGISRVVTGGDTFQAVTVRRDPELIAFTSTSNATGLLELQQDPGMLRPFESMGVDTNWELQLPKAANAFDFGSISDVLFTVEYTALQDFTYRQQVIQQLDDSLSAERVVSIRDQYADQWYALHNPEHAQAPMTITFTLASQSLPPNLRDVQIQQVLLAVARADGQTFEIGSTQLMLTPQGETSAIGGTVGGTTDGLVSTRRGNGSAWIPLIGQSPVGDWALTLPDTEEMRNRFKNEEIDDLLLVLTYEGRTPAWPM
ncbi:hypothetical protein [Ideonella sp.]|uniref:Tc toxin subunit A-related protein n=1 Tax=Ideonella sp. TaxID=1929293 RepID=UPI0035B437F7